MTNKIEELSDRELQERLLLNFRRIKNNVKSVSSTFLGSTKTNFTSAGCFWSSNDN